MKVVMDIHVFNALNFDTPKSLQLLTLVSLPRVVGNFAPGDNLLVNLIDPKHLTAHGDSKTWWAGSAQETKNMQDKLQRRKDLEAARDARAKRGEQPVKRRRKKMMPRLSVQHDDHLVITLMEPCWP